MSDHDPRVRELTYRLMEMAPDAPPFPEEATMTVPETKQRQPMLVWAAAVAAVVLLVGLPLFLLRGGDTAPEDVATTIAAPDPTTPGEPTTTVPGTTSVAPTEFVAEFVVYLFAETTTTAIGDPALVPVPRVRPYHGPVDLSDPPVLDSATVLNDAVSSLILEAPEAAYSTSVPAGVDTVEVSLADGVATVDLSESFEAGGGTMSMTTRLAQVVFTATQFDYVDSVLFMIDGEVVDVFSGEGLVLDGPQTREDYVDILPFIFLDMPAIGSVVPSPVRISGIANVFEATVLYEIVDSEGTVLNSGFTTATCGTGCWGGYVVDVPYEVSRDTLGAVVVYEESAQDGSRINELRFPVFLVSDGAPVPTTTIPADDVTATSLPGEAFDIGPVAGDVIAVVGVAYDDVLFMRNGPGIGYEPVVELDPLADDLVATGRHRLLESSIWSEIEAEGFRGWVNSRFIGHIGSVDDLTASVVADLGEIPVAETMVDLGEIVARSFEGAESGFRYEISVAPTVGDLGEITVDVIGLADDSLFGYRLHIFGQPTEGGEAFSLMSVEATAICGRGVTSDGLCV